MATKFLKESILTQAVGRKEITVETATKLLGESENAGYKFNKGEKLYVAHGQHAGNYGTFVEDLNGGYLKIDCGGAGKVWTVPAIFVTKSQAKA
jgi:hypothetical protein